MANSPAMESLLKYRFNRKGNSNGDIEYSKACQSPVFDKKSISSQSLFDSDSPIIESKKVNTQVITIGSSPWFSKNSVSNSQSISNISESSHSSYDGSSQEVMVASHENVIKIRELFPDMSQSSIEELLASNDNNVDFAVDQILKDKNAVEPRKRCFFSPEATGSPSSKKSKVVYSSDETTPQKTAANGFFSTTKKNIAAVDSTDTLVNDNNMELKKRNFYGNKGADSNLDFNQITQLTNELVKKNPLIQRTEVERILKLKNYDIEGANHILHQMKLKNINLEGLSQTENVGSMKGILASRAAHHKLLPIQSNLFKEKKTEERRFKKIIFHDSDSDDDHTASYSKTEKDEVKFTPDLILKFFNTATQDELTFIGGCSKKKADIIVALRPFENWSNLNNKLDEARLGASAMTSQCKELLKMRHSIQTLMEKCQRISLTLEERVGVLVEGGDDEGTRTEQNLVKQPALLNASMTLAPYQLIGLNWLILMHSQHINGILGDEMGLGKTIQIISFLAYLLSTGNTKPHVIISPSSTIDNWLRELKLWCPALKVLLYYGSQEERREIRNSIVEGDMEEFHIILTSYAMASGSPEDRVLFKRYQFEYAIFDEGHMLKNMTSLRYQNLTKILSKRRLLLTGTPLQNNLLELMSLLSFIMPEIFSGKTENFKKIFSSTGGKFNDVRGSYEKETLEQAKRILKPFFLRRLKSQVLNQLPTKTNTTIRVTMTTRQAELYDQLKRKFAEVVRKGLAQKTENSDKTKSDKRLSKIENGDKTESIKKSKKRLKGELLGFKEVDVKAENGSAAISQSGSAMMMQLRKAANHRLLHRQEYDAECLAKMAKLLKKDPSHVTANVDFIVEDMELMSDFELHSLCLKYQCLNKFKLDESLIVDSGKFKKLDELLPAFKDEV